MKAVLRSRSRWIAGGCLCAILLFMVLSCEEDKVTVTNEGSPDILPLVADVSVRVVSYPGGTPVEGATCVLSGRAEEITTDELGEASFHELVQGSYMIRVSAPGHAATSLYLDVVRPDEYSGEVHLFRDVHLFELTGSVRVSLFAAREGVPAGQATVDLTDWTYPDMRDDEVMTDPSVPVTVTADEGGILDLSGLPATGLRAVVHPYDADGDGICECEGATVDLDLLPGETVLHNLVLAPHDGTVEVIDTNVIDGATVEEDVLYWVFSAPMDTSAAHTEITANRQSDLAPIPVTWEWTCPYRLEVQSSVPLTHEDYGILVHVRCASGGRWNEAYAIQWGPEPGPCELIVSGLAVAASNDTVDFNTTGITLEWSALSCRGGYNVYAKDDYSNPEWRLIGLLESDWDIGMISGLVMLPLSFDRYGPDAFQTPFAGITVSYCVVPARAEVAYPRAIDPVIEVRDGTPPKIDSFVQLDPGWNPGAETVDLRFVFNMSEYVDPASPAPDVSVADVGGGGTDWADSPVWEWDYQSRYGMVTFRLSPGTDARLDNITFDFDDFVDISGNENSALRTVTVW